MSGDREVEIAFDKGVSAALRNVSRASNPYMPEYEADLYQAWNCGFDEEEPRYRLAPGLAIAAAARERGDGTAPSEGPQSGAKQSPDPHTDNHP